MRTLLQKTSLPMISLTVDLPAAMPPPRNRHTGCRRVPLSPLFCASQPVFSSAKISKVVLNLHSYQASSDCRCTALVTLQESACARL